MESIDDLKKQFIVDQEDFEKEKLNDYIEITLKYCKLDSKGNILILNHSLTQFEQVTLALIARFLGNKLQDTISSDVSIEELAVALNVDPKIISSRLTDLIKGKVIKRKGKGLYSVVPFYVKKFLEDLESKYEKKTLKGAGVVTSQIYKSRNMKTKKSTSQKKKGSTKGPKPKIDEKFKKEVIDKIDKSKHIYIYNLDSVFLKVLAILNLVRNDLNVDGLTSSQIMSIILERFRIPCLWSSVSIALKKADQLGYTDSNRMQKHSTGMKYRILQPGESFIKEKINDIKVKKGEQEENNDAHI